MNIIKRIEKNSDNSYNLILIISESNQKEEFSMEFINEKLKEFRIKNIKIIVASTLAITIPFYQVFSQPDRYAMSYVYFGTNQEQMEYISLAEDALSVVSPSYFDIIEDGSLHINYISKSYVDAVHDKGIKVVPFMSNHWDRQAGKIALSDVEGLSTQIANAIYEYNLDGINVDIENVTHIEKDQYTELIRLLRTKLPKDKEVSVAVAANPKGWVTGWHGSYDYKALGEYADHLFIMAYDEHYNGGAAGPVASIDFVESSIKYALKYVNKEKVVIGIPFFGRVWSTNGNIAGTGMSINKIEELLRTNKHTLIFDRERKSPKAIVQLKQDTKIDWKIYPKGEYEIWFENAQSIKEKLSLVAKYDIKGAGNWSSGQETKDVWDYYDLWLNNKFFTDIMGHFANDDIVEIASKGYMLGKTNTEFAPNESLTRAEAAVVLSRVLHLTSTQNETKFTDVNGHWAESEIKSIEEYNIINGYADGTFRPNKAVTREEMATMLYRLLKLEYNDSVTTDLSDVNSDQWSYNEVVTLAGMGIITGYPDNEFKPKNLVSRGESASLVKRTIENIKKMIPR